MARLEITVLDLIWHMHSRCGSGFGKYPLGGVYAIDQLLPLCDSAWASVGGTTLAQARVELQRQLDK